MSAYTTGFTNGKCDARYRDAADLAEALGVPAGAFEWHRLIEHVRLLAALPGADTVPWRFQEGDYAVIDGAPDDGGDPFRIVAIRNDLDGRPAVAVLRRDDESWSTEAPVANLRPAR
jgi:hypothetical protein